MGVSQILKWQSMMQYVLPDLGQTDGPTGIKYEDIAYGTSNGFASVGSNNGHNGTTLETLYRNPDVITDFAWRSCVALVSCLVVVVSPLWSLSNLMNFPQDFTLQLLPARY